MGLSVAVASGCPDETPASDVRGNYDLAYDDQLTITLKVGGAERVAEGSESEVVTWDTEAGPVSLDMAAFCGREDVQCPSETLWSKVSVDQPNIDAELPNTHVLNVINNEVHELPAGQSAEVVSGLIDERDRFGLILGSGHQSSDDCALLALSTAGGRFSHQGERLEEIPEELPADGGSVDGGVADGGEAGVPGAPRTRLVWDEGAPVVGIEEGKVKLGFLGACAFGPALIAATLEIQTGFTGVRTGDFDPPPFVPLDPADVDGGQAVPDFGDAGAGSDLDAGSADAG